MIDVRVYSGGAGTLGFPERETGESWQATLHGIQILHAKTPEEADFYWYDPIQRPPWELWATFFDDKGYPGPGPEAAGRRGPLLVPWPRPSLVVQRRDDTARLLDTTFLLRVLSHYGLVVVVPGYETPDGAETARRNRCRINRALASTGMTPDGFAAPATVAEMAGDLHDLQHLILTLRGLDHDQAAIARPFLRQIVATRGQIQPPIRLVYMTSVFDRLGKWSVGKSWDQITGACGEMPAQLRDISGQFKKYGRTLFGSNIQRTGPKYDPDDRPDSIEYRTLRDCGRWLKHGVAPWARRWRCARQGRPIRLLFIDPQIVTGRNRAVSADQSADRSITGFKAGYSGAIGSIFKVLNKDAGPGLAPFDIHVLDENDELIFPRQPIGNSIVHLDEHLSAVLPTRIKYRIDLAGGAPVVLEFRPGSDGLGSDLALEKYDAIFCDVDAPDPWGGPQVIHTISAFLERKKLGQSEDDGAVRRAASGPAIIVMTKNNRFEQAYECLNLGAHGFITKDRVLQAPIRLRHAVDEVTWRPPNTASEHEKIGFFQGEKFGHRTNFRILHGLSLEHKSSLKSTDPAGRIIGDELDRAWLRQLPKADLHVHLGSSISLRAIEAMAWNSTGRLMDRSPLDFSQVPLRGTTGGPHTLEVATMVIQTILGAAALRLFTKYEGQRGAARAMCDASEYFIDWPGPSPKIAAPPKQKPIAAMLERLDRPENAVSAWHITALVVVALSLLRMWRTVAADETSFRSGLRDRAMAPWRPLSDMAEWYQQQPAPWPEEPLGAKAFRRAEELICKLAGSVDPIAAHPQTAATIKSSVDMIEDRFARTSSKIVEFFGSPAASSKGFDVLWQSILRKLAQVEKRLGLTKGAAYPSSGTLDLATLLANVPTFAELVINPVEGDGSRIGLIPYLDGCDLLGSDHLQYPENVLLAATDFVHQNVTDNIVYSELRCETPGYTKAGMSALGATQLLQAGFDAAALYFNARGTEEPSPTAGTILTRVNILLAAKRHKRSEDCARVIGLLERYLEHDGERSLLTRADEKAPGWWSGSDVVGFDLSGNESKDDEQIKDEIRRLFKYNASITVHAGEAASAESVWEAVYNYHARRIGHGLRLRENPRLMRYCVDEGICMELCPTSNTSTHGFRYVPSTAQYFDAKSSAYPLRYYMEAGLEVCLNTDNRSLNRPFKEYDGDPDSPDAEVPTMSLTDEYLRAARLSGGLTRWEVLKLVRAGFKHSFLHRDEVAELLSAVEARLFGMVGQDPGTAWRDNSAMPSDPFAGAPAAQSSMGQQAAEWCRDWADPSTAP